MNVEQVAIDDLSAEILQELRPVVLAMRQRPDRGALFEALPGGSATGGAGRPGDENHGFRHRSPSIERCSLLTQQHYIRRRQILAGSANPDLICSSNTFHTNPIYKHWWRCVP